jgi:hypothetical protein
MNRTLATVSAAAPLKSKLLVALLLAVVAMLAVKPTLAHAASEIGVYRQPEVTCDAWMNQIIVAPTFGAGDMYTAQSLAFRFYAKNDRTGQTFWLSDRGNWKTFYHQRVGQPYYDVIGNWYPGMITPIAPIGSETFNITGSDTEGQYGQFTVYAQYLWYSPARGWLGPITQTATTYFNRGLGTTPTCLL